MPFLFFTWLATFTPVVQSCAELSNHIPSQLFFTLSVLVTKETVKWSLGSGAMALAWVFFIYLFIYYFIPLLSLLTSWEQYINAGSNCFCLSCQQSLSVHYGACMHASNRAIMSADPRHSTYFSIFVSAIPQFLDRCEHPTVSGQESVSSSREACILGEAWTSRRPLWIMSWPWSKSWFAGTFSLEF